MTDELIGKTIGGYEILSLIGEGGMATVYLARQQSMDRQVALKVLPKQFAKDDTYLQRFEREVTIVAKLEHRNIVPVYDYGEHDGQPYIVMRYLPAGSVDELLEQHAPLTPARILDIISQIAPALDYAHNQNVLHRDLKPSNVLMDDGGGAFLTDFGIARVVGEQGGVITTHGVVGTPAYMSPEQAQGRELDGRSDVYSLGVMLFEMATGRRPFENETPYSIAVMQVTAPPPSPCSLNPALSPEVEKVILKALEKQKERRHDNATALMNALKVAIERPELLVETKPPAHPTPQPLPASQAQPQPQPLAASSGSRPAVLPRQTPTSGYQKPARRQNPMVSALIGGTIGCGLLGVLIALTIFALSFFLPEDLLSDATATATPSPALSATMTRDATATPTLDPTSASARATLVSRNRDNDATATAVSQVQATPDPVQAVGVRGTPTLIPALRVVSGKLVFADIRGDDASLELVTLDLETWTETQLTSSANVNNSYPVPSPDGRWIAYQSDRDGDFEIYVMNTLGGQNRQLTVNTHRDRLAAWSPDGEWIIFSSDVRGDGMYDLRRVSFDGQVEEQVFSNGQRNSHARYSPDGRYLIFTTGGDPRDAATWEIARLDLQTGTTRLLTDNDVRDASPVWSPDGSRVLYITFDGISNAIASMTPDGTDRRLIYNSEGNDWAASYSPDGQYIVFTSDIQGRDQLYLLAINGDAVQQITNAGGLYGAWIPTRND
jgi:serine/threonine protein kinase/Tol biopolymer transport system component